MYKIGCIFCYSALIPVWFAIFKTDFSHYKYSQGHLRQGRFIDIVMTRWTIAKKYAIIAKQFGEDSVCSPKLKSITMFCKSLNLFKYFEILLRADTDRDEYRDILMSSFFCIFYSKWNVSQYQNVWLDSLWKYSVPSKANFKIHLQKSITSSPNIFLNIQTQIFNTRQHWVLK